jgi:putative exosortase-associated protein (TIGR04073 family)
MSKFHRFFVFLSCTGLLLAISPLTQADYVQEQAQNEQLLKHEINLQKRLQQKKYQRLVEKKAVYGLTNIGSSILEIPKNMINVTNEPDSNVFYGVIGGGVKGILDAAARVTVGTLDVLTAPLITKQVISPKYVWDDYDKSNTYDKVFRLEESAYEDEPVVQPVVVKPRLPVFDDADQYSKEQNNRRMDAIFENEMRK